MNFRASLWDPLKDDPVDFEEVKKEKIVEMFEEISWLELLSRLKDAKKDDIFSPIFEVTNEDNQHGLMICAIDGKEWYIYYSRPKLVKKFFGLIEKTELHTTDAYGQTENDVRNCLKALIKNDLRFLENKINLPSDPRKWRGF